MVGLVFPQLQDHDLIICHDWSLIQLSSEIRKTLDIDDGCRYTVDSSDVLENISPSLASSTVIDNKNFEEEDEVLLKEQKHNFYSSLTNGCEKTVLNCQPIKESTNNNSDQSDNQNLQNEMVQTVRSSTKKRKRVSDSNIAGEKAFKSSDQICDKSETNLSTPKRKLREKYSTNRSSSDTTTSLSSVPTISSKISGGSRKARCMSCPACVQPDCRVCKYCVDMKKYGGPGVKKQSCELRPKCQSKVKKSKRERSKRKSNNDWSGLKKRSSSSDLDEDEFFNDLNNSCEEELFEEDLENTEVISENCDKANEECAKNFAVSSEDDESLCVKTEEETGSLKCNNCEFIAKTETGLKKHKIRYHRGECSKDDCVPEVSKEKLDKKETIIKKNLDNWQFNCKEVDDKNSLNRLKTIGAKTDDSSETD